MSPRAQAVGPTTRPACTPPADAPPIHEVAASAPARNGSRA